MTVTKSKLVTAINLATDLLNYIKIKDKSETDELVTAVTISKHIIAASDLENEHDVLTGTMKHYIDWLNFAILCYLKQHLDEVKQDDSTS